MLILTRRMDETIMIGDDIKATILGISGNHVRIGVDAPKHIAVHREEIYQRIQAEKIGHSSEPLKPAVSATQGNRDQAVKKTKEVKITIKRKFDASTQTFPSDSNTTSFLRKVFS